MFITAKFVDSNGLPILNLIPKLEVWDVLTTNKIIDLSSMDEIAGGWYKYDFDGDYQKNYVVNCDGGSSLESENRYQEGTVDMTQSFLEQIERGRWKISNNQMIIYDRDNTTQIATFNLKDIDGNPTSENPLERYPA